MAAKLQCEICGGKLVGKPGGIFECESCGTEYSTEWAKAKIQEIQGTVKVEGTVDVKGTVQVEGPVKVEGAANVQSLIKRGNIALEDSKWDEAEKCFNDALNADPENAEAYLGLVMAKKKLQDKDALAKRYISIRYDDSKFGKEFDRAKQFGNNELKSWINELEEKRALAIDENKKRLASVRKSLSIYRGILSARDYITVGLKDDKTAEAVGKSDSGTHDVSGWTDLVALETGGSHTIGLRFDGSVVAVGDNDEGQCNVHDWKNIKSIAVGNGQTVGLHSNGTVVVAGDNDYGMCDVEDWTDIVAIAASGSQTIGIKPDGTAVGTGWEGSGLFYYCDVSEWKDIVDVSASIFRPFGFRSDGTIVLTDLSEDERKVLEQNDVVSFAEGYFHKAFLKSDGSVVAVGDNDEGQCDVSNWQDIVAIAAGGFHTVGLTSYGTVVATGKNNTNSGNNYRGGQCDVLKWKNIVAIAAGSDHTVGLKSDGTVVSTGYNYYGQCNTTKWKLFRTEEEKKTDYAKACTLQESSEENNLAEAASIFKGIKDYLDSTDRAAECDRTYKELKAEREKLEKAEKKAREARERAERAAAEEKARQERIATLNTEKANLQTELANLKGLFTGRRRKEIEARLAQIENELKRL